jgi:hypothetical protein
MNIASLKIMARVAPYGLLSASLLPIPGLGLKPGARLQ